MKEQDNIKELFSKGLENHASPVRPEVWNGLQAKMAAAGIASGSAAAVKGLSALAKWFIGGTAASVVTVGTLLLVNSPEEQPAKPDKILNAANPAVSPATPDTETSNETVTAALSGENPVSGNPASAGSYTGNESENIRWTDPVQPIMPTNPVLPIVEPKPASDVKTGEKAVPAGKAQPENSGEKPAAGENTTVPADVQKTKKPVSRSEITLIPNIITPNNDGANDYYFIESKYLSDFSIVIMNDKGQTVFVSSDPGFRWSGIAMNGENAPDGNYVAIIIAKAEDGTYLKERQPFLIRR